ncbi:hypothetical protein [Desulfovibrio cuneatus]|uniref:hypothetical protein n=1 Tax=Desulfovibrio cuneatus TaxID=159728 RepID=UPI0004143106|nr:hypothetical protein [Desulfovibrio cuneatus]
MRSILSSALATLTMACLLLGAPAFAATAPASAPAKAPATGAASPAATAPMEKPPVRDLSGQMAADDADLRAALQPKPKGKAAAKARPTYEECDKNTDGLLSSFEFRGCFPRSGAKFMIIDYNKDNKVGKEEIERYLGEPKIAKARKPETTPEQRKALRETRKEQRQKAQQPRRSRPATTMQ